MDEEPEPPEDKIDAKSDEVPDEYMNLLSILQDYGKLGKSSAMLNLNLTDEVFDKWVDDLEAAGWIKVIDRDIGEYFIELTEKYWEKIEQLKVERKEEATDPEEIAREEEAKKQEKKDSRSQLLSKIKNIPKNIFLTTRANIIDLTIFLAFLVTMYLIRSFVFDPNQEILNFLAAVVLFSGILFVYRGSKEKLKTKTVMQLIKEFFNIMFHKVQTILLSIFIIMLVYFMGWALLFPEYRVASLLTTTVIISSIIQLYYPLKLKSQIPFFFLGMVAIVYSILLLLGLAVASDVFLELPNRIVDAGLGLAIIVIVYIKRGTLGVRLRYFKKLMAEYDPK